MLVQPQSSKHSGFMGYFGQLYHPVIEKVGPREIFHRFAKGQWGFAEAIWAKEVRSTEAVGGNTTLVLPASSLWGKQEKNVCQGLISWYEPTDMLPSPVYNER